MYLHSYTEIKYPRKDSKFQFKKHCLFYLTHYTQNYLTSEFFTFLYHILTCRRISIPQNTSRFYKGGVK